MSKRHPSQGASDGAVRRREAGRAQAQSNFGQLAPCVGEQLLTSEGSLVMKVFQVNELGRFYRSTRAKFAELKRAELDSTRKTSNELYLGGSGFKN